MTRELEQQPVERGAALRVERGQQLIFDAPDDRPEANQLTAPLRCQADHMPAAVARVALALDQPAVLE